MLDPAGPESDFDMISLNSLPVKFFYYYGCSFAYKYYYFLFRGVYLPDANLFVVIIPMLRTGIICSLRIRAARRTINTTLLGIQVPHSWKRECVNA
jgi:hypothetical protein